MAGVNETISDGLGRYSIGEKLRTLRLRKSLGLVELGKHTGLSAALLSKLERGKLFPTLPTLLRIAMVFGVGLDFFFTDERKRRVVGVVRKDERVRFPERPGAQDVPYYFECLDYRTTERKLSAFLADFQEIAPEKAKPHSHPGVELLYIIGGKLVVFGEGNLISNQTSACCPAASQDGMIVLLTITVDYRGGASGPFEVAKMRALGAKAMRGV